eukprot:TRINITY_DN3056_c0_g1_i1.p1 TRINITY_DN3056_c0_g1~~TRINITY_DN3056_c0_g1_i1.p1  ORF type:complete len:191 (-),score=30.62 TRINITY_DN3056_c0_g1_i1:548-1120(-)
MEHLRAPAERTQADEAEVALPAKRQDMSSSSGARACPWHAALEAQIWRHTNHRASLAAFCLKEQRLLSMLLPSTIITPETPAGCLHLRSAFIRHFGARAAVLIHTEAATSALRRTQLLKKLLGSLTAHFELHDVPAEILTALLPPASAVQPTPESAGTSSDSRRERRRKHRAPVDVAGARKRRRFTAVNH